MSTQTDQFERAAAAMACHVLQQGGSGLLYAGATSLVAAGTGLVPMTIGALSVFASHAAGCWDSDAPPQQPGQGIGSQGQCIRIIGGCGILQYKTPEMADWELADTEGNEYEYAELIRTGKLNDTYDIYETRASYCGETGVRVDETYSIPGTQWRLVPISGTCETSPIGPMPVIPDLPYTDPETGCQLNINFQGFTIGPGDELRGVYKIEPAATTRATGGVITNCNFAPVIYAPDPGGPGGGGGGPYIGPWDPSWDPIPPGGGGDPPWLPIITGAAGGAIAGIVDNILEELFKVPVPQYKYTFRAACDYKQDGSFEDYTITLPEQSWNDRVLAMQEMNIDFLQQHLLWKTPTCGGGGQPVTGDPVTVNFRSFTYTPTGNNVARKRFVYFDQTGSPVETHVAHWKDFVWKAGPVWVGLKGTPLGTCQVWAETVEEGKRVISHAAQVAGVNVNDGEWLSGTSRDPRYGVAAEMHTAQHSEGHYLVTKRSGPNGNPFV